MRIVSRHLALGCLRRAGALAGLGAVLGALVGLIEEGNRTASAGGAGVSWAAALARVPEVVFFAAPLIAVLAVLWTARDLVPEAVAEGLGGAGVPARRIDAGLGLAVAVLAVLAVLVGGWLAPWAQRAAALEPSAAWARSGGAPDWAERGGTWIRTGGRLVRVDVGAGAVLAVRTIEWGRDGASFASGDAATAAGVRLPTVREVGLMATPPAFQTWPELVEASAVRARFGQLPAPAEAELALRGALAALVLPAAATGAACRRIRKGRRRWSVVALFVLVALLGLQATNVWATRGELPVAAVVVAPLLAACVVAAAAWMLAFRRP